MKVWDKHYTVILFQLIEIYDQVLVTMHKVKNKTIKKISDDQDFTWKNALLLDWIRLR